MFCKEKGIAAVVAKARLNEWGQSRSLCKACRSARFRALQLPGHQLTGSRLGTHFSCGGVRGEEPRLFPTVQYIDKT